MSALANSGPLLFVTGHAPAYRVGALARLDQLEDIEVALFGGRSKHGGGVFEGQMPFAHRHVRPRELATLAASGAYRAVVCPTGGRLALLSTWAGARRGGAPVILWASLWAHPRTAAHALSYVALRRMYRSADAVVTYGPHVSAYVRTRGARNVHEAPQSVDNEFWSAPVQASPAVHSWPGEAAVRFLFVGRPAPEKGLDVLLRAWREARLEPEQAALVLVGAARDGGDGRTALLGDGPPQAHVVSVGPTAAEELRSLYAASDVVVVPSIRTATFAEPWGLVANEAMNRGLPVIASDAVGAAVGGLVRDGVTGLVVPAGDSGALAAAIRMLAADPALRARLGEGGRREVRGYSHDVWARGFSQALRTLNLSRERC